MEEKIIRHSAAAREFLKDQERAAWQDETLWVVRNKRDRLAKGVPQWEELREKASQIKTWCGEHREELIERFSAAARANGAVVHFAKDAEAYRSIIGGILQSHGAHTLVKSKSMLSEECGLVPYLQGLGIDAVETDLGERIIQLLHQKPSHIVLPAIHLKREQVAELFQKEMGTEPGNCDPTYLTHAARKNLREKFLHADAGMTGANFAVASTGEVVVCTNEGNADMGTSFAPVQIAAFGIDKIVPDLESMGVFTRLLARSATGQAVTAYTTHYSHPREGAEFHIIIVDNGRSAIQKDPVHRKVLNCLRCGACMNTCPVYRRSGGYAYSYFIPGPIGINLGMLNDPEKHKFNLAACSLCHSCSNVCPAKVDPAEQIYAWRQGWCSSSSKHFISEAMRVMMEKPRLFQTALKVAPGGMALLRGIGVKWGNGRCLPDFPKQK